MLYYTAPQIRFTILALYKLVCLCMYVCILYVCHPTQHKLQFCWSPVPLRSVQHNKIVYSAVVRYYTAALWNRAGHYIFNLWFLLPI